LNRGLCEHCHGVVAECSVPDRNRPLKRVAGE
jgi:hypothetical protein